MIINLQTQLTINQKLFQKQTKMINKHRTKRAAINVREKKIIAKLKKMFQELIACKEENSQNNVIDMNVASILSFASKNLSMNIINLIFQNKLAEIALTFDEKKFSDAFFQIHFLR